ncbi:23S rRNA (pseudouridine(1915)-N(3))-methyltransferase RlmH [Lentisphaera marina]|uniref:23S rRNA (pseudouridine(1915)-N(3))-methyltransferase RlmH n=1 Tax=Lentisphaera marina TaxID=1111041 RepID=UPI0023665D65|nr:23S rRNA (pseudouridine(1915)-N(3))-methyltransferase RlmH [Lentisphaera marina]MDD7984920.1 23S rRNA (pseudouridine(1915)-N(3))-methyltransferase RlmH [Lentisphaera marina]
MLRVDFLVIGKTKEKWIQTGIDKYLKRLQPYAKLTYKELADISVDKRKDSKIIQAVSPRDLLILLDEKGLEFTSVDGAKWLEKKAHHCSGKIIFVVGSAYGFTEEEYSRADFTLSLSKMTFTHEMIRVFFLEQLYRMFSIQKGTPYHHV